MKGTTQLVIFFFILFWGVVSEIFAQTPQQSPVIEDVLEQLSASDEDIDWTNQIEELTERIQEPLNLNTITKEQLESFPFLTDQQIENILAYIYINGQMQTVYELQMVEEMDKQTIQYLQPFVYAEPVKETPSYPKIKNILRYGKHEVLTRLDIPFYNRKAYNETDKLQNRYWGPAQYHSLRYSFHYRDNLYAGVTAEKDAGEPFFAMHNKQGYDYYSFYFYLKNIGKLKSLALGNYRISFGQGLVISQDFFIGKTTSLATLSFRNNTIRKHSSTDEYNYLRGMAGSYQMGDFTLSAFYSHRLLDGIINNNVITSIQKTGLHRTSREAERRNAFAMQVAGSNITFQKNNLKVGITGIYYFFDRPYYASTLTREYAKYNLRGNNFYNVGFDYRLRWNRFVLSGEAAIDKNNSMATLNILNYNLSGNYKFMLIHRYYAYDYWAFFARSFAEGSSVQNENGWYLAAEITPFSRWKLFASVDFFSFPWLRYRVDASSWGTDAMFQATYTANKRLNMYFRYRFKKKDRNYTDANKEKTVRPLYQHKIRYQLRYTASPDISFRTTLDYTRVNPSEVSASQGFQVVQTFACKLPALPVVMELHAGYFHTDDYDSRVYSYEKGLLYSFYSPSFYGEGNRFTANIRYNINKNMTLIAKLGLTKYYDRQTIGSDWDEINNSKKTDLQLQFRAKF
ncbi:helix-hairpin-helix domain-containing protein [Bacteroides sp. 519]|uniref:helix-hairpin-helix domain-containing protein n=1 Tax=Bacteroides sp. 519 TaxID=2302937 RepID=UPI0013D5CFC9|nr:helix-hairpin-helix domain-containing protein [Bacteroides sp. 519]NDV57619.1 helix-hairpin-helix domain-containing protein [Bacteroides sp. 519]